MKNIGILLIIAFVLAAGVAVGAVWRSQSQNPRQPGLTTESLISPPPADAPAPLEAAIREGDITLTITSPKNGAKITSNSVTVRGKTAPRAEVFVNEATSTADANGNFVVSLSLDEGENVIVVFANDIAGNFAEQELTVIYESGSF